MSILFYEASVGTYVQILGAMNGVLHKGLAHFHAGSVDPEAKGDTATVYSIPESLRLQLNGKLIQRI